MLKKTISAILACGLLAGALAGCSGGGSTSKSDVTTIEMWSSDSHSKLVMNDIVREFNETVGKEKKINLVWTLKENGASDELKIALQQGKEPDIISCYSLKEQVENDYIVSLDDIPELADWVSKHSDLRMEGSNVYQGKMYLAAVSSQVYGLAYNKDMFKAAGIVDENGEAKPPTTLAELREDAKKLTNTEKREYGIVFPGKWGSWFGYDIVNNSANVTGYRGYDYEKGVYDYNSLKPMMQLVMDLKADGSVYPGMEGLDNDPARARFAEGNIGMKFAVSWDVGVWNDQFKAKCDWGIAPLPVEDENTPYYQYKGAGWTSVISKRNVEEKGTEAVAEVFKYLYSDETLAKMYKEGVSLPWNSDIVDGVELGEDAKTGWKDFADLVKISKGHDLSKSSDQSGYESIGNDFLNRVWTEEISIDQFIEERNKIANDGVKKYYDEHPEADSSVGEIPGYLEEHRRK